MNEEMRREMEFHPDLFLDIRSASNDSETQIEQIRELLTAGIDLLIVSPNEAKPLTPIIEEVYQSGIPVILIDRKTNSDAFTVHIGADNFEIGFTAAEYLASHLEGKNQILELRLPLVTTPAIERNEGFLSGISRHKSLEVVKGIELYDYLNVISDSLPSIIDSFPDIDAVFGHNDLIAIYAQQIVQEHQGQNDLTFVGVDGIPGEGQGIEAVVNGVLQATLLYPTGGAEAIQVASSLLHGEAVPKEYKLQTTVIDSTNVRVLQLQANKIESQQHDIERQSQKLKEQTISYKNQRTALIILIGLLVLVAALGILSMTALSANRKANRQLASINEEVISQRNKTIELANEAQEAHQAKLRFFTNISHEFRTPLTLILGPVEELLQAKNITSLQRKEIRLVRSNALRLLRLVNQLMDFRKIESNKMKLQVAPTDIVATVRTTMAPFERVSVQRNILFELISPFESKEVFLDADKIDKILFNILSNAFKFTKDHGTISVTLDEDLLADELIIKISDDGRGMSPEHVAHAFDRFYQGETYQTTGTGLGLSLSRELIQLHKGEITLQSEKGKGSTFILRLPLGSQHFSPEEIVQVSEYAIFSNWESQILTETHDPVESPPGSPGSPGPEPETSILIIEDQADIRTFLRRRLEDEFRILEAANGDSGIRQAESEVPDLILCDRLLPGKSGIEVTTHLRSSLSTSHIPIIMLTAKNTMDQRIEGLQSGVDLYITKPFHPAYLKEQIKTLLRNREILRERFLHELNPEHASSGAEKGDRQFINRFITEIETRIGDQDLNVQQLCVTLGMSRVQLYRKIKALLGYSVSDYIKQVRLKKASFLLLESDLTISEVAYEVGFSSPAYFSTAFKQMYQVSPKKYQQRKTNKKKDS